MAGGGRIQVLMACACLAALCSLGSCGEEDGGDSRATASPAPLERAHRGAANVLIALDTSSEMDGQRLARARAGLDSLVRAIPAGDRVGLARFSEVFEPLVPVMAARENRPALRRAIAGLRAEGDSAAYDSILQAYGVQRELSGGRKLNTVIVVAHTEDSASRSSFTRVRRLLGSRREGPRVRVFTIAYDTLRGSGLREALRAFARASRGRALAATPESVGAVLRRAWEAL